MLFKNRKSYILNFAVILALISGVLGVVPAKAEIVVASWAQSVGGTEFDYGTAIALDTNGNVYSTGFVTTSPSNRDIFINKLDGNGNFIWSKVIGGPSYDSSYAIKVDNDDNAYIAGSYSGTVDFDPGTGTSNLTAVGFNDIFLSKFDGSGNFIWAKGIGGTAYDTGANISVDGSGNIYLIGMYFDTVDFDPGPGISNLISAGEKDVFLSKFDGDGNLLWAKGIGGTLDDAAYGVAVDGSGSVFVTGYFTGIVDFDPGTGTRNVTSTGGTDIFISKFDADGNFVWATPMGYGQSDNAIEIAVDGWGNLYTVGYVSIGGEPDVFLGKLDGNGNFIWARNIGGASYDNGYGIAMDASGNVYFTGDFSGTVNFDPGSDTWNLTSAGWGDIFINKLDVNGNLVWAKSLGGTSGDISDGIAVDGSGNVYLTGAYYGTADFDPGTGISNLTSAEGADIFISKLTLTPQVHYVKWNASGSNNGTSWADAYTDLQSATSIASSGDEIWVAAGTYKPTTGTDRAISFTLKNSMAIYGGFAGTEISRAQRDYETNFTILSGDIGIQGVKNDNSYHVVVGSNTNNTAILDGFTVTGGYADNSSDQSKGGGMFNKIGSPTISNTIFIDNFAFLGGGMANEDNSNPTLTNVTFDNNLAGSAGGGIYIHGASFPILVNVTFSNNSANNGGGMYTGTSDSILTNTTFYGNTANTGGAIFNAPNSTLILTNVTISGNTATSAGGISNISSTSIVTISNSIVYGNTGGKLDRIEDVSYSIVQGGYPGTGNLDADPFLGPLADNGGNTQTIPLSSGSSAIDAGNDTNCPVTDQRGVARPQGSHCDIGAYEYQSSIISPGDTVRVSINSSGTQGDGYSYHSAISADGRYTVFDSDAANLVSGDTNGMNDIFVHDIQTGTTTRVSVDSNGVQGNGGSSLPSISGDGRYLAFFSSSTNLVSGDSNGMSDVFLHDMETGLTTRVSVNSGGGQTTGGSNDASLSADGHHVTFVSSAANLVSGDTNGADDVFVHDMLTGMTTRISVDSSGVQGNDYSYAPSISGDGRYIAFYSWARNLVPGDTNGAPDVFIHDLQVGITTRVSIDSNSVQGNNYSRYPSISGDGRYIAFDSGATNLVSGDINATFDIFVHDTQTGITTRVSVDSNGVHGNDYSYAPSISGDGRYIAFHSNATNLVPDDSNGAPDIFVHDIQTAMTTRVSVDSNGVQGNDFSNGLYISADGHYIAFDSAATNLVPGDTNLQTDVFVHRQDILSVPPTPTPTTTQTPTNTPTPTSTATYTPTFTPTSTPTNTPTISPTPVTNCNQITPGPITKSGNSMSMAITSPLTVPIQIQDVFVIWNHDKGHSTGFDKTLQLDSATLGSQFWIGTSNGPSLTITPSPTGYIPSGASTITFTFHQSYDNFDGTEQIIIHLATNGCQSYPIVSTSIATNTPTYTPTNTFTPTPTSTFTPTNTFTPTSTPPYSYNPLYLSLTGNQTIGGAASADEDILRFDGTNWSLFFDGSDVGVGSSDLFGFAIVDADTILMSFSTNVTVNGIAATPQDILRFDATSLGSTTSGIWSMYFDGSDVGFDTTAEKIDSVSLLPDGRVLLSTTGNPVVTGVTGAKDEDVLAFTPTALGNNTSGTWAMYFDGSDVGLSETSGEDVDALDVVGGKIYLSTADNFTVNGVTGADEDVFVCEPTSLGDVTTCNYSSVLYFDGSTWGLAANDVDAFNFLASGTTPTVTPTNTPNGPTNTPTQTPTATFTPTPTFTAGTSTYTSTPTNTATPTNTPNVSDLIFADGFESGNLSAWTSNSNDLGDLSVSPSAALVGTQGMQAVIDDANAIYVTDDNPNAEPRYRARFYFDPNSIAMASGDAHIIFSSLMGTNTAVLRMEFGQTSGNYQLRARVLLDDGITWVNTNWFTIIDTPHLVEMDWWAATAVGANNGGLMLWIDGAQQANLTGIDNDTWRVDRARLGALAGMDAGTSGTYYFDAFESRRQNYIGP